MASYATVLVAERVQDADGTLVDGPGRLAAAAAAAAVTGE